MTAPASIRTIVPVQTMYRGLRTVEHDGEDGGYRCDLLRFEDPVAFRYAYESGYRRDWDEGQGEALVVVGPSGFASASGRGAVSGFPTWPED